MMTELKKLHIKLAIEKLNSEIWKIIDILRSEGISTEDYHVLLFLLSVYKDGLLNNEIIVDSTHLHERFIEKLHFHDSMQSKKYSSILNTFEPIIIKLSVKVLRSIVFSFNELEKEILNENFPEIFDSVLFCLTKSQGKFGGEFMQPVELTRFICNLTELQPNSKIYNPFAGIASFGLYFEQGQDYFGQELNQKTWAIGILRILAYRRISMFKYTLDDSILHWPKTLEKFDLIVSNPPLGLRIPNSLEHIEAFWESVNNNYSNGERPPIQYRTLEQFVIDNGVRSLNEKGKLIAITSQGFLYKGSQDLRLRQFLVEEDLIDTIISLPGGLLYNTGIPLTIMVLNRKKLMPGKIKFIDAKKFVETKNPREKIFNDQKLINFLNNNESDLDIARYISIEKVRDFDYNLSVPRYFQQEIDGVKLGEIIEIIRGQRRNLPATGKLIRIRDLKEDNIDFLVDETMITNIELNRPDIHEINQSCLLVSARWNTLKPTFFEYKGDSIYRNQDILSFIVNENIADKGYLINELNDDYVKKQLDSFRIGTTIPFIRKDDLLEVVIKLPSIEEQRAKIQGIHELSDKIKSLQTERNTLAHGVGNKLYESVSSIKHSLGKPLLNIGSSLRNIENALSKFNAEWEHIKLNERYDITIKDSFNSVYSNLELIHSLLKNNESVLDVSNYVLKELEFIGFVKNYVKRIKSAERPNVITKLDIHADIKAQLKNKVLIQGNAELLEIALNAIVENANMHSFTNDYLKYKLEFKLGLYVASNIKIEGGGLSDRFETYIKVEVANNGLPFPENYTLEKLIRKNSYAGITGNTGQGGFDLNEIIKYHNKGISSLELILNEFTSEFKTIYSFLIPING